MELVGETQLGQLIVKDFVTLLKSVSILFAAIEINLDARLLDRSRVSFNDEHRIDRLKISFVRWIAENLTDQLHHELRAAIAAFWMRHVGEQSGAVSRHGREHIGILE